MTTKRFTTTITVALMLALLLTACGAKPTADPSVKMTEIAGTVQAQLTQSAVLNPTATMTSPPPTATATITPAAPTNTPEGMAATATKIVFPTQPANSTDNAKFIADVTIPDGTSMLAGEQFIKTWRIQNTGKTTWTTDYAIQYLEGNLQGRNSVLTFNITQAVPPGEFVDVSVPFTAPAKAGAYSSYWKMLSASGYYFGEAVSINIVVGVPTSTVAAPTATVTTAP